jgi:hypothetical protein
VGNQNKVIDNSLHIILQVPQFLPEEKRFDIMMLALILLINLIEQCEDNKKLLIMSKTFSANQGTGYSIIYKTFFYITYYITYNVAIIEVIIKNKICFYIKNIL